MLFQQLINGVMLGGAYALVAIGYSLVFGVLRLLHLAHGAVFMVGAYAGLQTLLWFDTAPVVGVVAAVLVCGLVGLLFEFLVFRPIRRRGGGFLAPMIGSIGAGLVIEEVVTKVYGSQQVNMPGGLSESTIVLGPVTVSYAHVFILATAIVAMAVLHLFVSKTRYGMAMRATAETPVIASVLGIPVDRVITLTLVIASALGGLAGILSAFAFNAVSPFMGTEMAIKGLAVMLVGGLGSIHGAMAGGIILGVVEVLSVGYFASSYRDVFVFGLMILILLVRPRGLFSVGLAGAR